MGDFGRETRGDRDRDLWGRDGREPDGHEEPGHPSAREVAALQAAGLAAVRRIANEPPTQSQNPLARFARSLGLDEKDPTVLKALQKRIALRKQRQGAAGNNQGAEAGQQEVPNADNVLTVDFDEDAEVNAAVYADDLLAPAQREAIRNADDFGRDQLLWAAENVNGTCDLVAEQMRLHILKQMNDGEFNGAGASGLDVFFEALKEGVKMAGANALFLSTGLKLATKLATPGDYSLSAQIFAQQLTTGMTTMGREYVELLRSMSSQVEVRDAVRAAYFSIHDGEGATAKRKEAICRALGLPATKDEREQRAKEVFAHIQVAFDQWWTAEQCRRGISPLSAGACATGGPENQRLDAGASPEKRKAELDAAREMGLHVD